jgi:Amidohydrolase family
MKMTALATLIAGLSLPCAALAQDYDIVIKGGRVMDPQSNFDAVRNVGVKAGKIAVITTDSITGKETVDAKGLVVAPGFIDAHIHGMDPYGIKLLLRDGVTTALELEAGAYPVEDFYNEFKGKRRPITALRYPMSGREWRYWMVWIRKGWGSTAPRSRSL